MNPSVACAATGQLPLLIIGLGPIGIEAALALAESARCCLSLVDDALADSRWRETASCLLHQYQNASAFASGGAAAPAGACKASTRSQYLASAFTYLSKQNVRAISPGGDASIIDNFKAVILTDPTLPHAIAFNEHARAVGCGFFLAEGRGGVGRIFRDLGVGSGDDLYSRSLRQALLEPYFSTQEDHDRENLGDGMTRTMPTPPMVNAEVQNASGGKRRVPLLRSRYSCVGRQRSSAYIRDQTEGATGVVAEGPSPDRQAQFHVHFQALHIFQQEHGHLPIVMDRDQAHEIVRIAEDVVDTAQKVPGGFSWQPESIDASLCCRMAAISRVAVPAVSFQLGGMVAAAALDFAEGHPSNRGGGGGDDMPLPKGRGAPGEKGQSFGGQRGARDEWTFVDTLDTGLSGKCPDEHALWTDGSCNDRVQTVDPPLLEAWLGSDLSKIVADARIAVVGCGHLGRDVARCLLLSGACAGTRGRMVFIDHGGLESSSELSSDCNVSPSRAAMIRDLAQGYTGSDRLKVSAFDGAVQDLHLEMDLWEGVDAVVVCAGRSVGGGEGEARGGWGETRREDCEALVRFVSHKCVVHSKPMVWGWAGGRGEGGAGVEVMLPGRTSCLVCSSHGGVQQLIKRRKTIRGRAPHAFLPIPEKSTEDSGVDESWDPSGRSFSVARSAVAGAAVAELVKVLKPRCRREELQNWRLEPAGGSSVRSTKGSSSKHDGGNGSHDSERTGNSFLLPSRGACRGPSSPVDQRHTKGNATAIRPVATIPDPPRTVSSTPFDPFTGDSVRAIPEGFTEWGVEDIRPSSFAKPETPRPGTTSIDDPFSLRSLVRTIFTRFGVDVKRVAVAAPGSECRMGAGRHFERGDAGGDKVLWAEWEKVEGSGTRQDASRRRSVVSKMDLSVLSLWQRLSSRTLHGEESTRALPGGKEPRFLFLDIGGVMGEDNVVLPVIKYWVR